jgi:hypothetical protein
MVGEGFVQGGIAGGSSVAILLRPLRWCLIEAAAVDQWVDFLITVLGNILLRLAFSTLLPSLLSYLRLFLYKCQPMTLPC